MAAAIRKGIGISKAMLFGVLLVVAIASVLCLVTSISRCPKEISTRIGEFDSKDSGLRASIAKLAVEIDRCPHAELYRVIWIGPGEQGERLQRSTVYYRENSSIGYEADAFSGTSETGFVIDDAAIRTVAGTGGTLEDFADYDQRVK